VWAKVALLYTRGEAKNNGGEQACCAETAVHCVVAQASETAAKLSGGL